MTVVIPTLSADSALDECVRSLHSQTRQDIQIVIVDNSARKLVRNKWSSATVIENPKNVGFGTAINQGIRASNSPFIATLNDDAYAEPDWIAALLRTANSNPAIGMCASQVRLHPDGRIDSAGMLICGDGSSKQRGHLQAPSLFARADSVLLPSGSAALYRRAMLDEIGGFDDNFFLYCEDTDLGLRARWAGWECAYVPDAVVHHRYSHSAGHASSLKAYYVERNRLFVIAKNFPISLLWRAPFTSLSRYLWHLIYLLQGKGSAAEFRQQGSGAALAWFVVRAHIALFVNLRSLLRERNRIRASSRLSSADFISLLNKYAISARQVAAH